jgi:SAM-dependent methyltransferase
MKPDLSGAGDNPSPLTPRPSLLGAARFDGLAQQYAKFRPSYPAELFHRLRELLDAAALRRAPLIVDVGCGTGISTRLLREAFPASLAPGRRKATGEGQHAAERTADVPRILGIEPSPDMRSQAEATTLPDAGIEYIAAAAESLPLADGSAALILAAQAAHWFDRPRFYREAARVLVSGGLLALAFNNRRWQESPFMDEHERLLERLSPGYTRMYREIDFIAEAAATGLFAPGERQEFHREATLTLDQWLGFCSSTTYVRRAVEAVGCEKIESEIRAIAERHRRTDGTLNVPYRTDLFTCRRADPSCRHEPVSSAHPAKTNIEQV